MPIRPVVTVALLALLASSALGDKLDDDLAAAKAALLAGDADTASDKLDLLETTARAATVAKPDDAHAHYILGMAAMYAGTDTVAQRSLDLAMRMDPKNARYAFGRAELASYQSRQSEAISILQRYMEQDPKNVEGWDLLGVAQSEYRQYAQAKESFQKAAELSPKEPKYAARVGETLAALGKDDDAAGAFEKAIAIDSKYAPALASLGDLHLRRKQYDKALPLFVQAAAAEPKDYRSIARQVQIHQAMGNLKERDAALEKVRALHESGKVEFATFCREQINRDKSTVMVFEYFPTKALDPGTLYAFVVLGPDGKEIQQRMQVAVTGESRNMPQYQLISDTDQRRRTITTFPAKPVYEDVRQAVVDFLDGKTLPPPPARGG